MHLVHVYLTIKKDKCDSFQILMKAQTEIRRIHFHAIHLQKYSAQQMQISNLVRCFIDLL